MSSIRRKVWNICQTNKSLNNFIQWASPFIPNIIVLGKQFYQYRKFLKEKEFDSQEQNLRFVSENLRSILIHAFEKTQYYNKSFRELGIKNYRDFFHIDVTEFIRSIPFIDKNEIKNHFNQFITKETNVIRDYVSTGGTSGEPFYFYTNSDRSTKEWAFMINQWSRIGYNLNSKRASFRGTKINGQFIDDHVLKERKFSSFLLNDKYLKNIWKYLISYNPDFIYAYPSAIYLIANFVKDNNMPLPKSLKGILIGSENIYKNQRNFIESVFNVKTFAWYGHSEKLVLAGECEYEKIYHADPHYGYVEFINENNQTAKPGEFAEIVGTGFINTVMPFIRYRTGDWCIYLNDHCSKCGRNFHTFKDVQGRWTQEMLVGKDNNLISMSAINVHSKEFEKVTRFQYYQDTPGKATLKIVPKNSFSSSDRKRIHQVIQNKMKDTILLDVNIVDEIPTTNAGKFKFIDQKLEIGDMNK